MSFKSTLTSLQPWAGKGREREEQGMKKEMKVQAEQNPSGRQAALVSALAAARTQLSVLSSLQGIAPAVSEKKHSCSLVSPARPPAPELQPQLKAGLGQGNKTTNEPKTVLSKGMGPGTSVVQVQPDTSFACVKFFFFAQPNFFTCSGDAGKHA